MWSTLKSAAGRVTDAAVEGFSKVSGYFTPEHLIGPLTVGFEQAGIVTVALLKNDALVRTAAGIALDLMPGSMVIKFVIGEERFVQFVFGIRDLLLAAGTLELSSILTMEAIRGVLVKIGLLSAEKKD